MSRSFRINSLLRNMGWLTLPNAIVKPLWFVFITYVCIRFMGLKQYGVMTAALALMSICDGSLTLGSTPYTIREVARDTSRSSEFFSNLLVSRMLLSLVAVGIGLGIRVILGTGALDVVLFAGSLGGLYLGHYQSGGLRAVARDVQLMMIAPAWLLSNLYRRLGIPV